MPGSVATGLNSYRRQNLLTEFASLKHVQPQGIYVSLTPGDPSLWSGVLFVRDGPYAPAVLRFRINFPQAYPYTPPLVTFNADLFHPLLFDATRSSQNSGNALSSGTERPPAGALSLCSGFSCWQSKRQPHQDNETAAADTTLLQSKVMADGESEAAAHQENAKEFSDSNDVYVVDILRYMRAVFVDASLLDAIPFEEAANQSAWYAWRACKCSIHSTEAANRSSARASQAKDAAPSPTDSLSTAKEAGPPTTPVRSSRLTAVNKDALGTPKLTPKRPSEWKWEGVWEMRARKGIEYSVADSSLFGASGLRDDEIHFISADAEDVEGMRTELHSYLRT